MMQEEVQVFAPATISNLGPGFDVLGLALAGPGDTVTARLTRDGAVRITRVLDDGGVLPRDGSRNTAGIAAAATLRRAGSGAGVELEVRKGMPIGSGLGSSAASAAAAALAVNLLLGAPLSENELVEACVEAETAVSGLHADNVAPALLGGLVLVRSTDPVELVRLPVPPALVVVVATPAFELSTRAARAVLPSSVPFAALIRYSANLGALVAACHSGDLELLGRALSEEIIVPVRAALIPGCDRVLEAAREAGALGSSISGAGPSVFALCDSAEAAQVVAAAMKHEFRAAGGLQSQTVISPAQCTGARQL